MYEDVGWYCVYCSVGVGGVVGIGDVVVGFDVCDVFVYCFYDI